MRDDAIYIDVGSPQHQHLMVAVESHQRKLGLGFDSKLQWHTGQGALKRHWIINDIKRQGNQLRLAVTQTF